MKSLLCLFALAGAVTAAPEPPAPITEGISPAVVRQAYDTVLPTLVSVKVEVKEEREAFYEERSPIDAIFDEFVRQRLPLRLAGVRISPEGMVLIRDPNLPLKRYGAVEARDQAGRVTLMRVESILENHAAVLLVPMEPVEQERPCITFDPAIVRTGDSILMAEPALLEDMVAVSIEPYTAAGIAVNGHEGMQQMFWWQGSNSDSLSGPSPNSAPLVLDARARPIGVALDNSLWRTDKGADSWNGQDIMADRRLSPEMLEEMNKKILANAGTAVMEIEIHFRSDSFIAQQLGLEDGKYITYGLHFAPEGRILIPTDMEREAIRQVEKFVVVTGDKRIEAQFDGLYRTLGAFVIRAQDLPGDPAPLLDKADFPRGKVFYTLSTRRRYGGRREEVEYNRYLDVSTGYKDAQFPVPRKPMRTGDLVTDADGNLIGFCAPFRRDDKDEILARQGQRPAALTRLPHIYLFSEVADFLNNPAPNYDDAARPMSKKEERALCWLGVEFQSMTPPLARALNAEGATRGGSRGLLVTSVYDASPASHAGIAVGDILLSLSLGATSGGEVDLIAPPGADQRRPDSQGGFRLWRPRTNYLTLLLTRVGQGRNVRLTLLKGKQEATLPLTIEKAPDDFDSADQYKESALGLTVKEMTYDVRGVLKLPADAPGVVVSEVVPGSKVDVAQVRPYEIITSVNGSPASSIQEFKRLVRAAQGRGRIEFLVMTLGYSRIVDVDLTAQ